MRRGRADDFALRGGGTEGSPSASTGTQAGDGKARTATPSGTGTQSREAGTTAAARHAARRGGRGPGPGGSGSIRFGKMTGQARTTALKEMAFCEHVLAKGGRNVVTGTLMDAGALSTFRHYPEGEVFDPESGAQWFYHCHAIGDGGAEHGHFHCFVRPHGSDGPVHHLAAAGVDAHGRLVRLFTVNHWVVGGDWLDAEGTIALIPRFDVHMPQPSYLVNRWLTAVFTAYEAEIADLIRERDRILAAHRPATGTPTLEDRAIEIASERLIRTP